MQQGQQQKAYADYQSRQATADAQAERDAAEVHADKIRKAARLQASEARASLAGSGVDVGEGSAIKIDQAITRNSEEDAWSTIMTGKNRGASLDAQAQGYQIAGNNAQSASYMNAASSVLSGATQIGKGWKQSAGSKIQ